MKDGVSKYLYFIFGLIGFVFLKSGYGKVTEGKFVSGLTGTLEKFASQNPYPFYKSFLEGIVIPNSVVFGYLTQYGEIFAGLSLLGMSLILIFNRKPAQWMYFLLGLGLLVGAFLNLTFWLASGWTSASTETVNFVMFGVQIVGLVYILQRSKQKS